MTERQRFTGFPFCRQRRGRTGTENGTYYMVITIPEDFSSDASTLMDDNPKKMELKYETNPGTNYIASKMSETALSKIREAVASKVTETYTQTVFDQIGTPTYARDLAVAIMAVIEQGIKPGVYNFSNEASAAGMTSPKPFTV